MSSHMRDIGSYILAKNAMAALASTAAGSGDASEVNGIAIDRLALGSTYQSAKLVVAVSSTLTSGKTVSVAANFQDSPNNSDWTDYGTALASTVVSTATSSTAFYGEASLDVNLNGADRYVRVQVTSDLSYTGTDTAITTGVIVFGGAEELPAA
jgi:hypothetical protein